MFRLTKLAIAMIAGLTISSAAFAESHSDPITKAIKARQSVMQLYLFNISILGEMAQGTVEYDADAASAAADNMVTVASINVSAMWPLGSDLDSVEGTKARPEIWTEFPDIATKGAAMLEAAMAMQAVAGTDLASLQAAMGGLGDGCAGCHKPYRAR